MLTKGFQLTFGFESEYPDIEDALEVIRMNLFDDFPPPLVNHPDQEVKIENAVECYNFAVDEEE